MIRILFFALLVLALAYGFSWLADRPGELSLIWQGQLYETPLMVAVSAVIAFVAAVMLVWWLIRSVWTSPHAMRRYFRARKRDRGYQALSTGLIAAGSGNALLARKMSARTRGLLRADQEPLIHLLEAQAALIEGKYDEARLKFEAMVADPETRELGLRGLYMEARRLGAHEAARQYAESAAEKAPYLPWAAQATLEFRCQEGRWDDAIRLLDQQKVAHVIERPEADRLKAVLLTAQASDLLEGDPKAAKDKALQALKLAKDLVPAALIVAKAALREDNLRKAASTLEQIWKLSPHPDVARLYVRARGGDSAVDRLKRAVKLETLKPNNIESLLAVSQAALDARQFDKARSKAEAAARMEERESVYLLLADIEEAETGDQGRIRHWMAQALKAPRDPAWIADGFVSDKWLPVSPVTGKLDAFVWKAPFGQIEGPVQDNGASAEIALASLPPLKADETPAEEYAAPPKGVSEVSPLETQTTVIEVPAKEIKIATPEPAAVAMNDKTEPEQKEEEPVPFFGRPPDDPGVKDNSAAPEPKTRLKLF